MSTHPLPPPSPEEKRAQKEKLIFAPKRVLDEKMPKRGPNSEPTADDGQLSTDEVHAKAFRALGLIEESARTKNPKQKKQTSEDLAMSIIDDPDQYLLQLESKEESVELGDSYENILEQEIQSLLAFPQVGDKLRSEIEKELSRYARVEDKLKRLRTLRYAIKKATLDMHATYLRSKRENKGTLLESAGKRIEALHTVVKKAEAMRTEITSNASTIDEGFINTQELIRYKRQIQEAGFALTPSREKLLQNIVEHAMAGHKVFLVGSTGTGKTELAFYALNETTGDYEIIPWHEGTVMKDVLGQTQITKTEDNTVESKFKLGPLTRAMQKGKGALHEEITAGSTRTMMGMKSLWNLKPGQLARISEMNGEAFVIDQGFLELFTGNPKSEQTKEREDLDPAILRMMKGIHIQYMPASELTKIAVAQMMDESGLVKLTKSEVELIHRLAEAAELMQQCHENALTAKDQAELKKACGIDNLRLQKNFLDPGTFFGLFSRWDYERRKEKTFRQYLAEQLNSFVSDPKSLGIPEEKRILLAILQLKKCISADSTTDQIRVAQPIKPKNEKPYILPSEMAILDGKKAQLDDDPLAEPDVQPAAENTDKDAEIAKLQSDILANIQRITGQRAPTVTPAINAAASAGEPLYQTLKNLMSDAPIDPFTSRETFSVDESLWFQEQFSKRLGTLDYFGFNSLRSIDGEKYQLPTRTAIVLAMTPEKFNIIRTFQKPMLIITPIGVSTKELKNVFASKKGAMKTHNPPANWWNAENKESTDFDQDIRGEMIYRSTSFDPVKHGGKTKRQLLDDSPNNVKGWQVLVVEGADDLDNKNMTANDTLTTEQQKGLTGLTPEDDLMLQAEGLRQRKPFESGNDWKWLTGAYIPSLGKVPRSGWRPGAAQVKFGSDRPGGQDSRLGSRPAVRLL